MRSDVIGQSLDANHIHLITVTGEGTCEQISERSAVTLLLLLSPSLSLFISLSTLFISLSLSFFLSLYCFHTRVQAVVPFADPS